jgi:hypothetical protein
MKAIPTTYRGIQFRSRLEATWAAFFDNMRWGWEYEPFDLSGWIPDFALTSELTAPRPVLVEVKPISAFDYDVAGKIDGADDEHEVLLVGVGPIFSADRVSPGWLREGGWWSSAVFGRWKGSENEKNNPNCVIGFCHSELSYIDRITGSYDGGHYGDGPFSEGEVSALWADAKNKVQWQPHDRNRPEATAARLNAALDRMAAHNERLAAQAGMASNPRLVAARDRRARISRELRRTRAWWE